MVASSTSRSRSARLPKRATIFCAEGLRAPACVVVDALNVRGWGVGLQTGDAARAALRSFRDPKAGLRVVCLAEPLDPEGRAALERALDPLGRKDLLIVDFTTPRAVVESVLRFAGYRVGARRQPRRGTRAYLAHPTLCESQLDVGYWSRYGMAAAAAGLAVLTGMSTAWITMREPTRAPSESPVAQVKQETSALIDDTVMAGAIPASDPIVIPVRRRSARSATGAGPAAPIQADGLLGDSAAQDAPLEDVLPAIAHSRDLPAAALARGGAPALLGTVSPHHRATPVDPFALPQGDDSEE